MKWNSEYTLIAIAYIIVILFISFINNPFINILLVAGLFALHAQRYFSVRSSLETERDITLKRLSNRLEKTKRQQLELNERFDILSQSFGSGLLLVDDEGIIQYSNQDMNEYFGRDFNNVDYQSITDIERLYEFVNEAFLVESPLQQQIKYRGRSYDLISTPLFDEDMFKGAFILAHDITQINNAQEYQKRFTADVSHELRTPLSAIRGFSEILLRDKNIQDEERTEFTELIHKESERMEMLLKDLSEISKLDRIDFTLDKEEVDISVLIQNCTALLSQQIKESNLKLETDIEPATLQLDANKMSQVIMNIVKNAINYTDEGVIKIKGYQDHNRYKLEISDTGIGIAEDDYDKIFKRFYRVDKARSRDTGGSGLGLSISKNTVLKHGGTIAVKSKLNKGSTFIITLPIKE